MSPDILLSICVPTFNRPSELAKTLEILGDELEKLPWSSREKIEIIVSDNHSESGLVKSLVESVAAGRFRLRLHIHPENVGPTLNFEYCYTNSRGRYILILSDDDHLEKGSLSQIFDCVHSLSPDIVFLPFFPVKVVSPVAIKLERSDFLKRVSLYPTLVSSCIFRRSLIERDFGSYLDTNMHHFFYFLRALESGNRFFYIQRQVLFCPYDNNSGGYNWFDAFASHFMRIINEFPAKRIDRKALSNIKRRMMMDRIIPTYFNRKVDGYTISKNFTEASNKDIITLVAKHCCSMSSFWIFFLPIAASPAFLLRLVKNLYIRQKSFLFKWH